MTTAQPFASAVEQWLVAIQVIGIVAAVVAGYLVLKLRHGWWPPRRPRG